MALNFDSTFYFNQRPDVLTAYVNSGTSLSPHDFALAHYNNHGWKEGSNPHPVFNTQEYLDANPDVKAAGVNPFDHFNNHGQAEGRAPSASVPALADFDWELYVSSNPDLGAAGINTAEAAYNHYINHGYAENRPGAPNSSDVITTKAIDALIAAQEAVSDFYADNAPATSIADLELAVENAETTLAGDIAANGTDAKLQADLTAAQKAVDDIPALAAAIRSHAARVAALDAATEAYNAADAEFAAAMVRYEVLNSTTLDQSNFTPDAATGELVVGDWIEDGAGNKIIEVDASGKLVLFTGVTESNNPGVTELLARLDAGVKTNIALIKATDAEADAAADVAAHDPGGLAAALTAAQTALDTRAELAKDVAEAKAVLEEGLKLEAALEAAQDAVEAAGFETVELVDSAVETGTADSDLFVFANDDAVLAQSIFGFESDDALYIGKQFKATKLDASANLNGSDDFGSLTDLEIFYQQVGGDTVIYIESNSYDGHANGPWGGETITLVGVDASSIQYENGFIRIADAVA